MESGRWVGESVVGGFNKTLFNQPVKNKQEWYRNIEMLRNYGCSKRSILDYSDHQNYYELSGVDLSRQINTSIPQQINFVGKLEEDDGASKMFMAEKQQKTVLSFSLNFFNCNRIIQILEHKKY